MRQARLPLRKAFEAWQQQGIDVPPVFIVVCNNTTTSQLIYEWIAGFERAMEGEQADFQSTPLRTCPPPAPTAAT